MVFSGFDPKQVPNRALSRPLILGSLCRSSHSSAASSERRVPPVTYTINEPRFSKAELKVQAVARRRANNQLILVPWTDFRKAYEDYPYWQALVLWVRAVMVTQDVIPSWLVTDLQKRCPRFIEHEAPPREPKLMALHLSEWIHNQQFGYAKRHGWVDALTFYGVRHPQSLSAWAYWEHCEEEWQRKLPSSYPSFEEWLRLAQNYNPHRVTSIADFAGIVDRYVEWKIFSCWLEPLTKAKTGLPKRIAMELERRCPGFQELNDSNSIARLRKKSRTGRHFMTWIEDHFFADAKKERCLDIIREQARVHPHYARIVQYFKRWNKSWSSNPTLEYPSFAQWCRSAEHYTDE